MTRRHWRRPFLLLPAEQSYKAVTPPLLFTPISRLSAPLTICAHCKASAKQSGSRQNVVEPHAGTQTHTHKDIYTHTHRCKYAGVSARPRQVGVDSVASLLSAACAAIIFRLSSVYVGWSPPPAHTHTHTVAAKSHRRPQLFCQLQQQHIPQFPPRNIIRLLSHLSHAAGP